MYSDAPRTLADQLRGWSDEQLAALVEARPDVAVPAPQDSAQLAARVATRPSVVRAVDLLDRAELAVLEAVVQQGPTSVDEVAAVVHAARPRVEAAVERLVALALVWGTPEQLRPVSVLAEVLPSPRGPAVDDVAALLDGLSPPALAMLTHLDERDADGRVESVTEPVRELVDRRLVTLLDDRRTVTVPWTVRVGLRDGRSTREPVDVPPALALTGRERVDQTASGGAFELVRWVELLLDLWGSRPPAVLRAGGLGVRDLRLAATHLQLTPAQAGLVVELARAAGLLAVGSADDVDPAWLPTELYDVWLGQPVAARWARLAMAWLESPRLTGLIGGRDEVDRPVNALSPDLERPWLVALRRSVLAELAGADGALAAGTGPASLVARLRWRSPRRPVVRDRAVPWTLAEAELVGVTGLAGLASYAVPLLAGDDPSDLLEPLLPEAVDHVLVQADLTAVAPGPLEQELARTLALVADVESRGGATVYRFGADSVRRAFDAGWSAVEVKEFLHDASRTPVPQALDYLVDDVSRRFGTVRVGAAEAFLRSDDETALTALVHDPGAASLRLRRIAPTVVVSDVPLHTLLPRLRELGTAPVVEAADGTVRLARPDVFRARTPRGHRGGAGAAARRTARTAAVVGAIRSGDRVARARPAGAAAATPGDVLALLRDSASSGAEVRIGYVDNHGAQVERVVVPLSVEGGQLTAADPADRAEVRTFAVHRIGHARRVVA